MDEQPPAGGEGWDLAEYEAFVDKHVRKALRNRYHRRADWNAGLFRGTGILVILLSALVPLLAGIEFARKDLTLGLIGVAIAVATGLLSFFQWGQLWGLLRRTDFELTELLAEWELEVANAKDDPAKLHKLTKKLLEEAGKVRRAESEGYFGMLRSPEGKSARGDT